jgi:sugar phosphate isomerase/epimerase
MAISAERNTIAAGRESIPARLAVCGWSLRPKTPEELIRLIRSTGVQRLQLALDPLREQPGVWESLPELCAPNGVEIVSGMFGTVGEDYSTIESIKLTGGVVPDGVWDENWRRIQAIADIAGRLGLKLVTFHGGFLPHDPADPAFPKLLGRIARIAGLFAARGIELGLETGQETAETLRLFLERLAQPNVGVNFDPANMILYDKGDPIAALRVLAPWLKQCHVKDAVRTTVRGVWGREVPVGSGEVDWVAFFRTLRDLGFRGDLPIEREAGEQRVADIIIAAEYCRSIVL